MALAMSSLVLAPAQAQQRQVPDSAAEIQLSFSPIVKRAAPAVVNVYATRTVQQRSSPLFDDPFFRQFFGREFQTPRRQQQQNSLGSGVIVDPSGLIVTNNHVIGDGTEVKVVLADRREFECDVVLKDEQLDLAVLKIRGNGAVLPTVELGESDGLEVGDIVLAIGNPFGVGQTVTQGIVSALARTRVGITDYQFFIQTDAAINPGNSGGALIDMHGRLVGINTAIFSRGGGSNGIGFAIPSDMVRVVVDSARSGSGLQLPWIGADLQPVTADIAESLGLDRPVGLLVTALVADGPAAKAGLRSGDRIVSIGDIEVYDPREFNYRLATMGVGKEAQLTVDRGGRTVELAVALAPPPETVPRDEFTVRFRSPFAGATIANLSPAVAREVGATYDGEGVVITRIDERAPAARVGLQPGDVILTINGDAVRTTADFVRLAQGDPILWRVTVDRGGRVIRMAFR
ncbi:DegQ family serine endoprotease [Methylobrevis sp. L22]|uniref:DegQ family serine endoprotease n=2 Tax=Methylobrevis albus TaxID=2793297 RepID=A0A931HYU1_9HYPH|nr:DegQ family serine endoprotease [Methylobrevis albus]